MPDEKPAAEPSNIRILYVGPGARSIKPGQVFTRAALAQLGVKESDLLSRQDAELTDDPATVEIDLTEKPAA